MKKVVSLLLAMILLCTGCTGGKEIESGKNDVSKVEKDEIRLYMLMPDSAIQEFVIDEFERKYPGQKVHLEVGVSEEDGITIEDAIKNLNAEMMAGNGPDVIFLDGLPTDDYIEKGLLADLRGILNELKKDGEVFFENVLSAYEKDGKMCAIPFSFAVPIVVGNEDAVQQKTIHDLTGWAVDYENDSMPVLGKQWVTQLPNIFLTAWKEIFPNNKKVDKEALTELLRDMKQMAECAGFDKDLPYSPLFEVHPMYEDKGGWIPYLAWEKEQMLTMLLCETNDLEFIKATRKIKTIDYEYLNRQSGNSFFPNYIIGINASSGKKETAEEFVKYFLSAEKSAKMTSYACVNKGTFEKNLNVSEEEKVLSWVSDVSTSEDIAEDEKLYYYELTPQEAQEFLKFLDKADTMVEVEYSIVQSVMYLVEDYIFEEETLEDTVDKIAEKVEIYQAE